MDASYVAVPPNLLELMISGAVEPFPETWQGKELPEADTNRCWDVLRYTLCGDCMGDTWSSTEAGPAALVLPFSTAEDPDPIGTIGDFDVFECMYFYLLPDKVAEVAAFMAPITAEQLRTEFFFDQMMATIPPPQPPQPKPKGLRGIFYRPPQPAESPVYRLFDDPEEVFDWLWETFEEIAEFYAAAAERGDAVVLYAFY
jgi:hypothetical protein